MPNNIKLTGIAIALTLLSVCLTGCMSDAGTTPANVSQGSQQPPAMRYYGGPKYPMWPGQ